MKLNLIVNMMSNPKERAIELVRDMEFEIPYVHDPTEPQGDDIAKKCAIIAVNEMIKQQKLQAENMIWSCVEYYQKVKQEIEKL